MFFFFFQGPSTRAPAVHEASELGSDDAHSFVQNKSLGAPLDLSSTPRASRAAQPAPEHLLDPEDYDHATPVPGNEGAPLASPPARDVADAQINDPALMPASPPVSNTQLYHRPPGLSNVVGTTETEAADLKKFSEDDKLSPVRKHYLIRALVALQSAHEMSRLEKLGTLTVYGPPFSLLRPPIGTARKDLQNEYTKDLPPVPAVEDPYAKDGLTPGVRADDAMLRRSERITEPLILRHLFHTHLRTFPGLDTTPTKFWQQRIQLLFDEMAARNLSTSLERGELTQRRVCALVLADLLSKFFARGVGVRGEGEVRGPGRGPKGSERWGVGKKWGKGTVKRGLDVPISIPPELEEQLDNLFAPGTKSNRSGLPELEAEVDRVWRLAGQRARQCHSDAQAFKETLIEQETGLEDLWDQIARAKRVADLPPRVQRAWAEFRHSLAVTLHDMFVASPNADQWTKTLKSTHALFPYWGAKQLLRYNRQPPHVLVQSLLSLLLGRPTQQQAESKSGPSWDSPPLSNGKPSSSRSHTTGPEPDSHKSQSLLQRMVRFHLSRQLEHIKETLLRPLRSSLSKAHQGALANRLLDYANYADRVERSAIERRTLETGDDVITTIFLESPATGYAAGYGAPGRSDGRDGSGIPPELKPVVQEDVLAMQRAFALSMYRGHIDAAYPPDASRYDLNAIADAQEDYLQSRPSPDEEQWTLTEEEEDMAYDFAQLKLLLREARRLRDQQQLLDVAMGPLVPTIIKDLLEYALYDGFKACASSGRVDLSRMVGGIQDFVDDLLRVRHRCLATYSQLQDQGLDPDTPGPTEFVALLVRHQDGLLRFVHDMHPLMEPILEWIQLGTDYLALSTSDPAHPADRTRPNIELNMDKLWAEDRLRDQDRHRILQEIDELASWTLWQKIRSELEARREILFALDPPTDGWEQDQARDDDRHRDADLARQSTHRSGAKPNAKASAEYPAQATSSKGKQRARSRSPSLLEKGPIEEAVGQANLPPEPDFIQAASDVDRLVYRLMRLTGHVPDEGLCPTEARGTETRLYPGLWCGELDPLSQQLMAEERVRELRYTPLRTDLQPPSLLYTRKLLPAFRAQIAAALPTWTAATASQGGRKPVGKSVGKSAAPELDVEREEGRRPADRPGVRPGYLPGSRPGPGPELGPGPALQSKNPPGPRSQRMAMDAQAVPPGQRSRWNPPTGPPDRPLAGARGPPSPPGPGPGAGARPGPRRMPSQGERRARAQPLDDREARDRHSLTLPRAYVGPAGLAPRPGGPGSTTSPLPPASSSLHRGPSSSGRYSSEPRSAPPLVGPRPGGSIKRDPIAEQAEQAELDRMGPSPRSPVLDSAKNKLGEWKASLARGLSLSSRTLSGRDERRRSFVPAQADSGWDREGEGAPHAEPVSYRSGGGGGGRPGPSRPRSWPRPWLREDDGDDARDAHDGGGGVARRRPGWDDGHDDDYARDYDYDYDHGLDREGWARRRPAYEGRHAPHATPRAAPPPRGTRHPEWRGRLQGPYPAPAAPTPPPAPLAHEPGVSY